MPVGALEVRTRLGLSAFSRFFGNCARSALFCVAVLLRGRGLALAFRGRRGRGWRWWRGVVVRVAAAFGASAAGVFRAVFALSLRMAALLLFLPGVLWGVVILRLDELPGGGAPTEQEDGGKRGYPSDDQDPADDVVPGSLEDPVPVEGRPSRVAHGIPSGEAENAGARFSSRLITASVGPSRWASRHPR